MAAANDRARQYLERSVPDLKEFERKKIFSKEEIAAIVHKRSEFELILNTPGCQPQVYVRYIQYETNLENLRRKRVQRLGVKSNHGFSAQKRIFSILDRATKKFPGSLDLWMQYIEFCRKNNSYKKLDHVLTKLLRLHPTKPDLWTYAARYEMEANGSVASARLYLQRGLRFCEKSKMMWTEYAKLEMSFIAKIEARREVYRLHQKNKHAKNQLTLEDEETENQFSNDQDVLALPETTMGEMLNDDEDGGDESGNKKAVSMPTLSDEEAKQLEDSPLLSGAIPIVVFDTAMGKFDNDIELAEEMFCTFLLFDRTPCTPKVLEQVLQKMTEITQSLEQKQEQKPAILASSSKASSLISTAKLLTTLCSIRLALLTADPSAPSFVPLLSQSLSQANSLIGSHPEKKAFIANRMVLSLARFVKLLSSPQSSSSSPSQPSTSPLNLLLKSVLTTSVHSFVTVLAEEGSEQDQKVGKKMAALIASSAKKEEALNAGGADAPLAICA